MMAEINRFTHSDKRKAVVKRSCRHVGEDEIRRVSKGKILTQQL
jgi:hypothetical protein